VALLEVPDVPVVDTIGAGDAFGAGFLAAWTRRGHGRAELGDPAAVLEATRFAIETGARTVGRAGADPPTSAELLGPCRAGRLGRL
jgi:fructokinase